MNVSGFALAPVALEAQISVSDPAVIVTTGATVDLLMNRGLVGTVLALPWASPGPFLNV